MMANISIQIQHAAALLGVHGPRPGLVLQAILSYTEVGKDTRAAHPGGHWMEQVKAAQLIQVLGLCLNCARDPRWYLLSGRQARRSSMELILYLVFRSSCLCSRPRKQRPAFLI